MNAICYGTHYPDFAIDCNLCDMEIYKSLSSCSNCIAEVFFLGGGFYVDIFNHCVE